MIRKFRANVTGGEALRLPQMHQNDTYQEMQQAVSESYAQQQIGPFPESEHQKPYENPEADYQQLENAYAPWSPLPYQPFGMPEFAKQSENDDDICLSAWDKFLATLSGAHVSEDIYWRALNELASIGCLQYVPRFCCPNVWEVEEGQPKHKGKRASGDASIMGPGQVVSGESAEYTYLHAQPGCSYSWSAKKGYMVAGEYVAPNVSADTTDDISVYPFMGDDRSKICATRRIKITTGECGTATPSPTILQMGVGTTQTLTILTPTAGAVYTWVIVSGGGSLTNETLTTIDYVAPSENGYCANNPTIELRRGGNVCGTVKIAINASPPLVEAMRTKKGCEDAPTDTCVAGNSHCCTFLRYDCAGTYIGPVAVASGDNVPCSSPESQIAAACRDAADMYDNRTELMKAEGCCPIQLL